MEKGSEQREDDSSEQKGGGTGKKVRNRYVIFAIVAVVLILVASYAVLSNNRSEAKDNRPLAASVTNINATAVGVPVSSISQTATWYQYRDGNTSIRFFAVKDSTGTVHTAFDECPYCYPTHQGFRQQGTTMMENCCNMGIEIKDITETGCVGAACHPAYLASHVEGDRVAINVSDLVAGAYLFA